jgi:hypothetical protein
LGAVPTTKLGFPPGVNHPAVFSIQDRSGIGPSGLAPAERLRSNGATVGDRQIDSRYATDVPGSLARDMLVAVADSEEGVLAWLRARLSAAGQRHGFGLLRSVIRVGPAMAGVRLSRNTIDGHYLEDAWIHRLT